MVIEKRGYMMTKSNMHEYHIKKEREQARELRRVFRHYMSKKKKKI